MRIKAIAYQREDGLEILEIRSGWVVRHIDGLCWFYHPAKRAWIISTILPAHGGLDAFAAPFDRAMEILRSVEKPSFPPASPPAPAGAGA